MGLHMSVLVVVAHGFRHDMSKVSESLGPVVPRSWGARKCRANVKMRLTCLAEQDDSCVPDFRTWSFNTEQDRKANKNFKCVCHENPGPVPNMCEVVVVNGTEDQNLVNGWQEFMQEEAKKAGYTESFGARKCHKPGWYATCDSGKHGQCKRDPEFWSSEHADDVTANEVFECYCHRNPYFVPNQCSVKCNAKEGRNCQ